MKKKLVVLTGAGISAESGIKTFRDSDGLWENHNVQDVASIEGWHKDKELILRFYNSRRHELKNVKPNMAHEILTELEKYVQVYVLTQNIDNLHERAGNTNVLHLHGELTKACSSKNKETHIIDIGYADINIGDKSPDGSQSRPYIVWFGEQVPMLTNAAQLVESADITLIIGTSLNVYPAAGLINYAKQKTPIYLIDPKDVGVSGNIIHLKEKAGVGMEEFKEILAKII